MKFHRPKYETLSYREAKKRESWDMPHRPDWEVRVPPAHLMSKGGILTGVGDASWHPLGRTPPHMPETEYQALMEAAPHEEPMRSKEELSSETLVQDLLALLSDEDQLIVEARVFGGMSYQDIADRHGFPNKVWVLRRWREIRERLVFQLTEIWELDELGEEE